MPYLLDADTFIRAKNDYYRFSFCPAYWNWIVKENAKGVVFSIDTVWKELQKGNDDLSEWAKGLKKQLFITAPSQIDDAMTALAEWASSQEYSQAAVAGFLARADYFLVAYAKCLDYTVVSLERPDPRSKRAVKIPDACRAMGVSCISPFQMLDDESARFNC